MPTPDRLADETVVGKFNPAPNLPDEQVEHPDEGRDAPLSVNEIKIAINARANDAAARLDALRKERDKLNREVKLARSLIERNIKYAVTELAEAKRIANALKPRTRTKKPAAK